jgi:hypothetical protein
MLENIPSIITMEEKIMLKKKINEEEIINVVMSPTI